jgi:hypothetical protein
MWDVRCEMEFGEVLGREIGCCLDDRGILDI